MRPDRCCVLAQLGRKASIRRGCHRRRLYGSEDEEEAEETSEEDSPLAARFASERSFGRHFEQRDFQW